MGLLNFLFTHSHATQIVFKNTAWLYLSQILSKFIRFFLVILAARELAATNYGLFNYATYLLGIFFIFSDCGLSIYLVREYQKNDVDKEKLLSATSFLKIALLIIISVLCLSVYPFLDNPTLKSVYLIMFIVYAVGAIRSYIGGLAFAHNHLEYESWTAILDALITTGFGVFLLKTNHSVTALPFAYAAGSLVSLLALVLLTRKYVVGVPRLPEFQYIKKIFSASLPFVFSSALITILSQTDILVIKLMKGLEAVGYYSVGLKIVQMVLALPGPILTSLFPVLSSLNSQKGRIASILQKSLTCGLMIGIPITVGSLILAPRIIVDVFGTSYSAGIRSFQILALLIPLLSIVVNLENALAAMNYQFKNMVFTYIAGGLNILLNILLVPLLNIEGAALATVLSQIVNLSLAYRLAYKVLHRPLLAVKPLALYCLSSFVMALVVLYLSSLRLPLTFLIVFGAVSYFALLVFFREDQLNYVLQTIRMSLHRQTIDPDRVSIAHNKK